MPGERRSGFHEVYRAKPRAQLKLFVWAQTLETTLMVALASDVERARRLLAKKLGIPWAAVHDPTIQPQDNGFPWFSRAYRSRLGEEPQVVTSPHAFHGGGS